MNNIQTTLKELEAVAGRLRPGQLEFVKGCQRQFREKKQLSEKQIETLTNIKKWVQ